MKTHSITLPLDEARQAFSAVLPHVSVDDVTPVITCAEIQGNRLVATDRYSVGTYKLSTSAPEGARLMIPLAAVKWAARFVTKNLLEHPIHADYKLTIEAPDQFFAGPNALASELAEAATWRERQVVEMRVEGTRFGIEASRRFRPVFGVFPPVARLVDEFQVGGEEDTTVALGARHIEKFTEYAKRWELNQVVHFTMSKSVNDKPGPVLIKIGDNFLGMLQPNLMLR